MTIFRPQRTSTKTRNSALAWPTASSLICASKHKTEVYQPSQISNLYILYVQIATMSSHTESASAATSTHTLPTASQRDSLAADRARISYVVAYIAELERSLRSLQQERNLIQRRLDAYTYPVLTLPNEIMSEIFVHFLPVYPKRTPANDRTFVPNRAGLPSDRYLGALPPVPILFDGQLDATMFLEAKSDDEDDEEDEESDSAEELNASEEADGQGGEDASSDEESD
ncbi:hypothetical protein FB451DRAFT_1555353 [Mycena latifolia]|nr:hypothetical protein FB451DRAFT_1555353 [Mycena latifolia]